MALQLGISSPQNGFVFKAYDSTSPYFGWVDVGYILSNSFVPIGRFKSVERGLELIPISQFQADEIGLNIDSNGKVVLL